MKITIIGTGYVGLVTGACFADKSHQVLCLDIDHERLEKLKIGDVPFYEPGLADLIKENLHKKRITFSSSYLDSKNSDVYFICVGTPDNGQGKPDLRSLTSVLESLNPNIQQDTTIFTKSTVPIGTNRMIDKFFKKNCSEYIVNIASNPEFLKEGSALNDFFKPDRIVIGTDSEQVKSIARDLYAPFNWRSDRMLFTSVESAEMIKYSANSFLATRISFMNEISRVCDQVGANIHDVRKGIGSDPRIGNSFLYAGLGYGGSCFPKDINALIDTQRSHKLDGHLLTAVKEVNDSQLIYFKEKIIDNLEGNIKDKNIAVWGLSFKPNSDDVRESVAIKLIKELSPISNTIYAYDPKANNNAIRELSNIENINFCDSKDEALKSANFLIICTEWSEFWDPDPKLLNTLKDKLVVDGRNILNKQKLTEAGIKYIGVGS